MDRTVEQIKEEIKDLKERRYYEEMADFMNWSAYNKLSERIEELEAELKAKEGKSD